MIVNGDRESFLCVLLPHAAEIQLPFDFTGFGNVASRFMTAAVRCQFFVKHPLTNQNTIVANIYARPGDKLFYFGVRFAAKTAERDICRPRHAAYSFLSARLVARSASPGISFRDCTTSSTNP